jgi:hypothetical protein
MDNVGKAKYLAWMVNVLWPIHWAQYYLGKVMTGTATQEELKGVPAEYEWHLKVFSEKESQWLPNHMVWDHAIKLLPGALSMLPG